MRLLATSSFMLVLAASPIFADIVANPLEIYPLTGTITTVDLTGVPLGDANISTSAYLVQFLPYLADGDPDNGVVKGDLTGKYANPVEAAGPTYWSQQGGNYFSTGTTGSTTRITFTAAQSNLAFLWGSVDIYNSLTIHYANGDKTYTGSQAAAAASILPNGNRGYLGSAWVTITPDSAGDTYHSVEFTSTNYAFEFADVDASTVPDSGGTLMLFGSALVGVEVLRRKFRS